MKKLLSLLLAALLLLSMAASAESDDPYGKYDELITISYLGKDNSATTYDSSVEGRKSPYDNVWMAAYEKYLNIKIERTVAEDDTALAALVTTQLASGDLPDIMLVPKALFYTLAENDVLADLEDAYEEYAGRLVMSAVDSFPDAIDVGYYNGKMVGFPLIQNVHNVNQKVLWVRTDWLDALGLSIPTTMDELYDVATAFKEAQFGGENTYGIATDGIEEGIMSGFGAVIGTWTEKDGKYVYANTIDECKKGLEYMQNLYADGLLRSDFSVSKSVSEDIANGLVGLAYGNTTWGVLSIQTCYNNDPNAEWTSVRIPSEDGEPCTQLTNKRINYMLVVNKNCEHPEALFKMLELELHMYYEPNEEERLTYYACEDGYLMENLRVIRIFGMAGYNVLVCNYIVEGVANGSDTVNVLAQAQYENVKKGLAGDRSLKGRAYVYTDCYQLINQIIQEGNLAAEYNGPTTENMTLYLDTINTALDNAMLKIVMGEDIDTFDAAVAEWYANGGEAITEEINDYYSR